VVSAAWVDPAGQAGWEVSAAWVDPADLAEWVASAAWVDPADLAEWVASAARAGRPSGQPAAANASLAPNAQAVPLAI
jgi:hypothetical protein